MKQKQKQCHVEDRCPWNDRMQMALWLRGLPLQNPTLHARILTQANRTFFPRKGHSIKIWPVLLKTVKIIENKTWEPVAEAPKAMDDKG